MGNAMSTTRPAVPDDTRTVFDQLDVERKGYLTLKDILQCPSADLTTPRSLPALFFFDQDKDGTLTANEFQHLIRFLQSEKQKIETSMKHDKPLRDLIHKASLAGVKDCSVDGRTSYRRFSSFRNVRSVYMKQAETQAADGAAAMPPPYPSEPSVSSPSEQSQHISSRTSMESPPLTPAADTQDARPQPSSASSFSSGVEEQHYECSHVPRIPSVSMFASQREFEMIPGRIAHPSQCENDSSVLDQDPRKRTALGAAVLESIMHTNIHKLADLLHGEGTREEFMAWLWKLVNFNRTGVITMEELRVFLEALREDNIDMRELVFYREPQATLEESVINEFDTTHGGMLSRDEFMVLADLVTREYEFWENRHLERVGDYELGRTIGRGSSAVVRYAMHVETREKVAIKIIKKGKCSDLSRLDREIQSLMAAQHKNIVALQEVLESENNLHIVMELCGGGSMVDIVRLYPEERMPEETARFFIRQVFEALSYCHDIGICHRDVRLDNLMLDNEGNVKITDFGHSGMYTPGWDMFSSALVGSVYNLSPEQIVGQVYSGERIDIWSAGVAVYCLLVGRPPFYEPEVNALLERVRACDFEIPEFVSPSAADFIRCMIRAVPGERIPLHQMLHHPWFYDGPEFGPSMNVVVIPVDEFFEKRPDIAEMIMAMTIYQHHLHFHLADTQNPRAAPLSLRGQDWTLKCLCPKNDIKFTVSLFTRKPEVYRRRKRNPQLTSPVSLSTLSEPSTRNNPLIRKRSDLGVFLARNARTGSSADALNDSVSQAAKTPSESFSEFSAPAPPRRRRLLPITPMDVAARLRMSHGNSFRSHGIGAVLDLDELGNSDQFPARTFRDDVLSSKSNIWKACGADDTKRNGKWRSFDKSGGGGLTRLNRSATVDAFPYQKIYPKRKMPESARNLNFDRPRSPAPGLRSERGGESLEEDASHVDEDAILSTGEGIHQTESTQKNVNDEPSCHLQVVACHADQEIAQKLCQRPSKAISPQSPQISRVPLSSPDDFPEKIDISRTDAKSSSDELQSSETVGSSEDGACSRDSNNNPVHVDGNDEVSSRRPAEEFQPFIEVRLEDGESGIFLKICRTLKAICSTKLREAAQQKRAVRRKNRRSSSALRRTASGRSMESDVTEDEPRSWI